MRKNLEAIRPKITALVLQSIELRGEIEFEKRNIRLLASFLTSRGYSSEHLIRELPALVAESSDPAVKGITSASIRARLTGGVR